MSCSSKAELEHMNEWLLKNDFSLFDKISITEQKTEVERKMLEM